MVLKLLQERKRKTLSDINVKYKRFCSDCGGVFETNAKKQNSKNRLCEHCKLKKLKTAIIIQGTSTIIDIFKELSTKQKVQFNDEVDDYMKKVKEFKDIIAKQNKEKKNIEDKREMIDMGDKETDSEFSRKSATFVKHIQNHIDEDKITSQGGKVVCKICDKTIDEIFDEEDITLPTQRDYKKEILDIIKELEKETDSKTVSIHNIKETSAHQSINPETVDEVINKLKKEGEIFEPERDIIRRV